MLKNALLYEKQLREKYIESWYNPFYQYYFGYPYRSVENLNLTNGYNHNFVSVDNNDEVIGFFSYNIDYILKLVNNFGAINFNNNKIVFGKDLFQVIDNIFIKFGFKTLEFSTFCGNPIEKTYDKITQKLNGRILCERYNRGIDIQGNPLNDKLYEIEKEGYLKFKDDFKNKFKRSE